MKNVANKNEQRYTKAIKALAQLVCAEDYKDQHGRGGLYEEMRGTSWKLAREVLAEYEASVEKTSSEFTCKCGKQKGWIIEGKGTQPCPECGRRYIGYYDHKSLTITGREVA